MAGATKSSSSIALIALMITCMGIFGMASLNIAKMMKEISIRKVLGASILNIINLVNKDFIKLMAIATIIGVPVSYYMLKIFLDSLWEYHHDLDPVPFILAVWIILFSAALTISLQVYKAAVANPVDMLRDE
jgi:putative ABC transport system permease protein